MKLIALGDNVIDYYCNTKECFPGGNAVNVAVHAARQGADAAYLGALGSDEPAKIICQALEQSHVNYDHCPVLSGKTTKLCNYTVENGERSFVEVVTGESWAGAIRLSAEDMKYLSEADIIVSSCNAKMPEQMEMVQNLPPVFAFDFGEKEKYRTEPYLDQVCHAIDLALFSCHPMTEQEFAKFCAPLHRRGVVHVLATMGSEGQILSNGREIFKKTIHKIVPSDTMGAGDSFLAAFLCRLYESGWRKGKVMPEEALTNAIKNGQEVSANNCLTPGGIGIKARISSMIL